MVNVQFSDIQHTCSVEQPSVSSFFSSCKTETIYPLTSSSSSPPTSSHPCNHHSFCFYDFLLSLCALYKQDHTVFEILQLFILVYYPQGFVLAVVCVRISFFWRLGNIPVVCTDPILLGHAPSDKT